MKNGKEIRYGPFYLNNHTWGYASKDKQLIEIYCDKEDVPEPSRIQISRKSLIKLILKTRKKRNKK